MIFEISCATRNHAAPAVEEHKRDGRNCGEDEEDLNRDKTDGIQHGTPL